MLFTWRREQIVRAAIDTIAELGYVKAGAACLVDASLRVVMATALPVDVVPVLDDVLLAATFAVLLLLQRLYGRAFLSRHGLRREGVRLVAVPAAGRPGAADAPS